ncbi:MAG: sulfite exporter TauE/SafE family protein [Rhodospirillaceae bacterium]|nr:sulfite exporter TauE/SafE family protein [Rhodospirillaceae bacterium]
MVSADLAAIASGVGVGLLLGLLGGGGSILAVPLLLYVVGITDPHVAIGTAAVAVTASAIANLLLHARAGTVKWPCAMTYAASGVAGAFAGAALGQAVDGHKLLLAFAVAMLGVAISMFRRPEDAGDPNVHINAAIAVRLVPTGLLTGLASGFFGIGGGFLIVPGLMSAAGMTILNAVGSSLVAVSLFGASTAASYAWAGLVDWRPALFFIAGGVAGGLIARSVSHSFVNRKKQLSQIFAGVITLAALYIVFKSIS